MGDGREFWDWRWRFWGYFRYVRARDAFQLIMALAVVALAINGLSQSKAVTLVAGVAYVGALIVHSVLTIRQRKSRDRLQAEIVTGLFHQINTDIFRGDHRTRFTLFRPAPLDPREIIAWFRYNTGTVDAIVEARQSRAHYRRGEGLTGQAWAQTRRLLFRLFPKFSTRAEFIAFYVDKVRIRKEVVDSLSDHMEGTETIFAYGFEDGRGKFLGVLSLDLSAPLIELADSKGYAMAPPDAGGSPIPIDHAAMVRILCSVQSVLESLDLHAGGFDGAS